MSPFLNTQPNSPKPQTLQTQPELKARQSLQQGPVVPKTSKRVLTIPATLSPSSLEAFRQRGAMALAGRS